jgi:predicted AAA+ superfamily ATPase
MRYRARTLESAVLAASRRFPVVLVTGPRQVGKTTLLRRLREAPRRYVTLDDPPVRSLAKEDPALFLERFPPPLIIDEIQYAPELLPLLKISVDRSLAKGAFWLTGSQHFHMMRGVSESLAGRVAILNLLGFSSRERLGRELSGEPFLPVRRAFAARTESASSAAPASVFRAIWNGSFPGLSRGAQRDLFFGSYVQTYLQRDVRDLAQVGDQLSFLRFLKACAARTAQMLNASDLARDVDVSVKTAQHWLSILQASGQIALLPPFSANLTKRLVKAPKMYFLDTGLAAYLTDWSSSETLAAGAMSGAIFETHVFGEILKSWQHRGLVPPVYYYRDRDGREVDFLLVRNNTIHPVEVKLGATPRSEWARHFAALGGLGMEVGEGAVVCLCRDVLPLNRRATAIPVGLL